MWASASKGAGWKHLLHIACGLQGSNIGRTMGQGVGELVMHHRHDDGIYVLKIWLDLQETSLPTSSSQLVL